MYSCTGHVESALAGDSHAVRGTIPARQPCLEHYREIEVYMTFIKLSAGRIDVVRKAGRIALSCGANWTSKAFDPIAEYHYAVDAVPFTQ